MARTMISTLSTHLGETVTLEGWVAKARVLGGLTFLVLRERSGLAQVVLEKGRGPWPTLAAETVVRVTGSVVASAKAPGGHELLATHLEVLAEPSGQLAVEVSGPDLECGPEATQAHRVLTMRHPKQAAIFKVQAAIAEAFATFLTTQGFLRIFSPKIIATATEGGSELFPLSYFGAPAYLAQSPQIYKQMLVGSGAERVFEIGAVYRAEPHETARHLNEYVSLDVEVGFITGIGELMALEQALLTSIFAHLHATCGTALARWGANPVVPAEIPTVTLAEALAIVASEGGTITEREDLSPEGERLVCAYAARVWGSEFVFVTGFPAGKRPFYAMPTPGQPGFAESFDLLYRGLEITTGGQRIHQVEHLEARMGERGMTLEPFAAYLAAFRCGMPPHGGFAIGLERLTARILGLSNVREATLFPRTRHRLTP